MPTLETIQIWIAIVALVCGGASFLIYVLLTLKPAPQQAAAQETLARMRAEVAATPGDMTDLLKALASLADSLAKAGPALWSMIGAALFLLIAAVSAGVLEGKPSAAAEPRRDRPGVSQPATPLAKDSDAAAAGRPS